MTVKPIACISLLLALAAAVRGQTTFFGLTQATPRGVSADGTVVTGVGTFGGQSHAFRWTAALGVQDLDVPSGASTSTGRALSADGSFIVGSSVSGVNPRPFRWTSGGGFADLNLPGNGSASGVSADGSFVVGTAASHAYRWTSGGGKQDLGAFAGNFSTANDVGADGSVVVGNSSIDLSNSHAFRWTSGGMQDIGDWGANAVSADGLVIVGASGAGASRWTQGAGLQALSNPLLGHPNSESLAVNADGSIVVGYAQRFPGPGGDPRAFYWTGNQMLDLNFMLAGLGVDLTGWTLTSATGVSDDGRTVIGDGLFNGVSKSFVVTGVPNPATVATFGLLSFGGLRRRRN